MEVLSCQEEMEQGHMGKGQARAEDWVAEAVEAEWEERVLGQVREEIVFVPTAEPKFPTE